MHSGDAYQSDKKKVLLHPKYGNNGSNDGLMLVPVACKWILLCCRCWINHYTTALQGLTWKISLKAALFMWARAQEWNLTHFTHSLCVAMMMFLPSGLSTSVCFDHRPQYCLNCMMHLISYTTFWIHLFQRFSADKLKKLLAAEQPWVKLLLRQRNQRWEWMICSIFTAINVINPPFTFIS